MASGTAGLKADCCSPRISQTVLPYDGGLDDGHDNESMKSRNVSERRNPRCWSPLKKRLLFTALVSSSLLADGGMTWGATLVVTQAQQWNITVDHSATSLNYGILLQGFGGIVAVPLIEAYGRLPVWLWSQIITMFVVLGATLSDSWSLFTAFRSLQGFFGTVPQVVGLPIIYDMYAPEEWPRMINIWGTTFLVGPFIGPALAGYILNGSHNHWVISFGALTALYGVSTLLIIICGHETYYVDRSTTVLCQHSMHTRLGSFFGIGNTGVPKWKEITAQSKILWILTLKPSLLLPGIATMINFCWPIGITTTIDAVLHGSPYDFDTVQASSMRFAGVIGALSGYIFGYFFNEWIFSSHQRHANINHNQERTQSENDNESIDAIESSPSWCPEYRLHGIWFPIASLAAGLLTYGFTLHFGKHWIGLAFGWVMVNLGMIASTVAITAYALEKYPSHSTCVSAIINMWRTCGGFSVGYFQSSWISRNGAAVVFGIQAAVVVAGALLTIVPVMILARRKHNQATA